MAGFQDLVIFIPGILGSVLEKNGKTVWDLSVRGAYAGTRFSELLLDAPSSRDQDIDDGIKAVRVVDNLGGIPGLWKLGGYSRLRQRLVSDLALRVGENYREFPYDWRRDNRVASSQLAVDARGWLTQWRTLSGNAEAKIWIVAHSMGGLVARYFLECLEGWKDVRSLITIGTPHRGSGKAADFLNKGIDPRLVERFLPGLQTARNFDSVYQLLPIYPFIVDAEGAHKVHDVSIAGIDQARAINAANFHSEIEQARASNLKDSHYRIASPRLSVVVGTDQPTFQSAMIDETGRLVMSNRRDFKDVNLSGDGTVPRVSAIPPGFGEEVATFVCNSHAAIAGDKVSLHHIRSYLMGANVDLNAYRDDVAPKLSLEVADSYSGLEPVEIRAKSSVSEQTLTAVITNPDRGTEVARMTLYRNGDEFVGRAKLQAGFYRSTISLLGREVSDIFWVLDV
ncbi:lipase/acyltransferase domain-containing protein [Agrobacterium vitis]|uniref:lipase/acyltransferase domain-containing protein n=1 Tax=Agrobacterium vitis TaxID=373 RepID=UPI0012E71E92|nr:hypothetical protein [Agrobacterium vitis]MVA64019.1 hypothetical protein [Agrobacterium vitis]